MFTEGRGPSRGASFTRFSGVDVQLFGITQKTLEAALHGTEVRQEAIARNLANANTPGYKRTDVSFQRELAEQLQFDPAGIDGSFEPTVSADGTSAMRVDGSNVDIDREATNLAENQLMFSSLMSVVTKNLQTMSQVITGAR
jgi:flagellar basal-body rod protein FlgB